MILKYNRKHYLKPPNEVRNGFSIKGGIFKGWLRKINHREQEKVIKWTKELMDEVEKK